MSTFNTKNLQKRRYSIYCKNIKLNHDNENHQSKKHKSKFKI